MHVRTLSGPTLGALGAVPCPAGNTTFVMPSSRQASPCSLAFLGKFQGLQRAINAYVLRHGILDTINVDGDIGPITLSTAQQIWQHGLEFPVTGWPPSPPTTAKQLADNVDLYSAAFARGAGASPDTTADPATQKPAGSDTSDFKPPGPPRQAGNGGIWVLAALAGVAAYSFSGKNKKKRKR